MTSISKTSCYVEVIVPHLQRMINLKKLALYFVAHGGKTFIDGNNLKKNIINHMPRLNEFIFNICSIIPRNQMHLLSNENIHRTFTSFKNYKVITCVDYFPKKRYGQYHIYSYPYPSTHYDNITNNFPGRLFNNIEEITLFGARPFEEELFIKISPAFSFLKNLTLTN